MSITKKIKRIPHILSFQYWKQMEKITHHIAPFKYDAIRYYRITGIKLDWKNPHGLSEKLLWLNRYWQPMLKAICADKYLVKDYIKSCGLDEYNVKLLGVWDDPDDIDFDILPNQFALKTNNAGGTNILCKDKHTLDISKTKEQLRKWLKINPEKPYNEQHYKYIKPCIIAEELLPSSDLYQIDYKFQCINGEPYCILVCADRDEKGHAQLFSYNFQWQRISLLKGEDDTLIREFNIPKNLNKMIEIAKILSCNIPFVRIDFYEVNGKLYIGELTFTPYGNIMTYYKDSTLEDMGKNLVLPPKVKYKNDNY